MGWLVEFFNFIALNPGDCPSPAPASAKAPGRPGRRPWETFAGTSVTRSPVKGFVTLERFEKK
jgi:hypothetical protein